MLNQSITFVSFMTSIWWVCRDGINIEYVMYKYEYMYYEFSQAMR